MGLVLLLWTGERFGLNVFLMAKLVFSLKLRRFERTKVFANPWKRCFSSMAKFSKEILFIHDETCSPFLKMWHGNWFLKMWHANGNNRLLAQTVSRIWFGQITIENCLPTVHCLLASRKWPTNLRLSTSENDLRTSDCPPYRFSKCLYRVDRTWRDSINTREDAWDAWVAV